MKKQSSFVTATVLAILLSACGHEEKPAGTPGPAGAMPPAEVDVIEVASGSPVLTRDLPGRLQAYRTAQVRARVEGIVEQRVFSEGSDVRAGETLFRIDARNYQAAFDAAKADEAVTAQSLARYKRLFEVRAVNQQDLELAEAKHKQAEAALSRAKLDLDNTRVPAPISGRIGRALVTEGALVGRGEATHLATIEQISTIYADFTQSGVDLLRLRQAIKGGALKRSGTTKVELVLEDGSVYRLPGKLVFSDLAVDPGTGSVSMRAEFPNPEHELLPGMFVRVRFPEAALDNGITVPQRAVQAGPQGQFVLVVAADGKVAPHPIKTGGMSGGDFVVSEGLKPGELVIVNGIQKARPGSVVKPVLLGPTATAPAK